MQSWTWLLHYPKDPLPSPRPLNLGTAFTTPELFTLHLFHNSLLVALSVCLLPHLAPSPASFLSINTGGTCVAEDTNMEVATKSMCSYTSLASSSKGGLSFCSLKSNSSLLCGGGRCCDLWASTRHCMPVLRCQDLGNTALPWNADSNRNNSPALNLSVSPDKVKGKLESLFYCDTGVPEEKIEKPTGLPKGLRSIGNKPKCPRCKAKGAVHCATCSGSGLYVDSILESQGIIVKVRCLGCGGSGNHMCLKCGGRGHV
ncbi:unnamed protein product [Sphagnum compactum]